MLPYFVIIGAMKGGTTSLYHYLSSVPDMVPSSKKETDFFKSSADFSRGKDWYEQLFPGDGRYAFEASPNYTKRHLFPGVPARMYAILPRARLIYVLRDPIERVVSHYAHNLAQGRETRALSEAIMNPECNYIQTSKYYYQLLAFLDYYPDEQIMLVQSEELSRNASEVIGRICSFLGIPFSHDGAAFSARFQVSDEKRRPSRAEHVLRRYARNIHVNRLIGRAARRLLRRKVVKPVLSESEEQFLGAVIEPDIAKLRHHSGRAFAGWRL